MGRSKALLTIGSHGETFLVHIVGTLRDAGLEEVIVVVGADAQEIIAAVERCRTPPRVVQNREPDRGQLSSLLTALEVIDRPGVRAMLVTLVDVPLVTVDTVRAVVDAYRRSGAPIVRPAKDGRHGHPVVFDRAVFDELRRADPAQGAKSAFTRHAANILDVPVSDEGSFEDIDTPADYERIIGCSCSDT